MTKRILTVAIAAAMFLSACGADEVANTVTVEAVPGMVGVQVNPDGTGTPVTTTDPGGFQWITDGGVPVTRIPMDLCWYGEPNRWKPCDVPLGLEVWDGTGTPKDQDEIDKADPEVPVPTTTSTLYSDDDQVDDVIDETPPTTEPWSEPTTTTSTFPATTTTTLPPTTTTTVPPTTTTTVPPTTTTTLPAPPARPSNLGLFTPGWDTNSPWWVAMAQTYVGYPQGEPGAFWSAISHRVGQMNGAPCFVYVNGHGDGLTIDKIIDGTFDAEWAYLLDIMPSHCIFAPIAEANGNWVSYEGTVQQVTQAYAKLSAMDAGRHTMCGSFTIMPGSQSYINAVAPYVDYACPSHYTWSGGSATTLGNQAKAHAANAGLPLIWAQGGTSSGDKVAWAIEAANAVAPAKFIYFDAGEFAVDGGWPW